MDGTDSIVLAGGRIFATTGNATVALPRRAAGTPPAVRCAVGGPHGADGEEDLLGGATSASLFALSSPEANSSVLQRLSASTDTCSGRLPWPASSGQPVRVANAVWLSVGATTLEAWPVTGTPTKPLTKIAEHSGGSALQDIADAGGDAHPDDMAEPAGGLPGAEDLTGHATARISPAAG